MRLRSAELVRPARQVSAHCPPSRGRLQYECGFIASPLVQLVAHLLSGRGGRRGGAGRRLCYKLAVGSLDGFHIFAKLLSLQCPSLTALVRFGWLGILAKAACAPKSAHAAKAKARYRYAAKAKARYAARAARAVKATASGQ